MRYPHSLIALIGLLCAVFTGCNSPATDSPHAGTGASTAAAIAASAPLAVTAATAAPVATTTAPVAPVPVVPAVIATAPIPTAPVTATLTPVTIHLAGDSTVCNYDTTKTVQEGWGMELGQFFNDQVTVNNQAIGGANVQSFKGGSNWSRIIAALKPGDYVLMQFGANDSGTAHGPVSPPNFVATLGQMADEIRAKGATPIFVTPSAFFQWSGGKQDNSRLAPYAAACYTAGTAKDALVDDLNARGVEWLNSIGQTAAAGFYLPDRTGAPDKAHFIKSGATQMAKMVAEEIRRIHSPLAAYLK